MNMCRSPCVTAMDDQSDVHAILFREIRDAGCWMTESPCPFRFPSPDKAAYVGTLNRELVRFGS